MTSPLARSSSRDTSFLMRLTFRLRPPSLDRILLIFCYRTYFPRLPRPPQTFGTRGPRWRLPRLAQTTLAMPAIPSDSTLPSCGMALLTGCPRLLGRPRLQHLLRQQVLSPLPLPGSGSASTTVVVQLRRRLHSLPRRLHIRHRRHLRAHCSRQCCPRLQHRRSLLRGRLIPRRVPCRRPCSGTASPQRPPVWLLRCQATLAPRSPMRIGVRRWLQNTRRSWTMAPSVSFLDRLEPTSSPASGSSSTSIMLMALWLVIKPDGSFVGSRSSTASTTTRRSVRLSNRPPSGSSSASPPLVPGRSISWT